MAHVITKRIIHSGFSRKPALMPVGVKKKPMMRRLRVSWAMLGRPMVTIRSFGFCCSDSWFPLGALGFLESVDWNRRWGARCVGGWRGITARRWMEAQRDLRWTDRRPDDAVRKHWPRKGRSHATAETDMTNGGCLFSVMLNKLPRIEVGRIPSWANKHGPVPGTEACLPFWRGAGAAFNCRLNDGINLSSSTSQVTPHQSFYNHVWKVCAQDGRRVEPAQGRPYLPGGARQGKRCDFSSEASNWPSIGHHGGWG